MENQQEIVQNLGPEDKGKQWGWMRWLTVGLIAFLVMALVFSICIFFIGCLKIAGIEGGEWGQLGDFYGGIFGTILSALSIVLLIRTLKSQQEANRIVALSNKRTSEVYDLQQFNEMFKLVLDEYHTTINNYQKKTSEGSSLKGKDALKAFMAEMQEKVKTENTTGTFQKRIDRSVQMFEDFYTENLTVASVHFRLLYRIFQLIEKSKISVERKREVAKIVRCQLSEQELFLLRYNAMSRHGKNVQKYINQYNLLKHLPLLSKLEFASYAKSVDEELKVNIINTEFYMFKQETAKLLLKPTGGDYEEKLSERCSVKLHVNADRTSYKISILRREKVKASMPIDEAFDKLTPANMLELLKDFTTEVFLYSNFNVFNDAVKINIDPHTDKQNQTNITTVYVEVVNKEGYKLKCTQRHLDNPQS